MKLNIKGLVFVGFAAAVFASAAQAADKVVTSKTYVDAKYDGVGAVTVRDGTEAEGKLNKRVITVAGYQGATEQNAGVPGLVPSAATTERGNFLKGDGTWAAIDGTAYVSGNTNTITMGADDHTITAQTAAVAAGSNALVTGDAVASYVKDGTLSIQVGTNQAQEFTANQAGSTTVQLGSAAGANLAENGVADAEAGLVSGDEVHDYITGLNLSGNYQPKTGENSGTVVGYDNGTWKTLQGGADTTVGVDPNDNTKVKVSTTVPVKGISIDGTAVAPGAGDVVDLGQAAAKDVDTAISSDNATSTDLPTTAAVYNFVTTPANVLPTNANCTTSNPCALVMAGDSITWEPIQQ